MRIHRKMLRYQRCVYWAPADLTEEGRRTFAAPVELMCRWEDVAEQFVDRSGNEATSKAKVYVESDVATMGVLWLPPNSVRIREGQAIDQLTSETNPFANDKAYEIRKFDKLPTPRPRSEKDFVRTAWL